jgi:large subunit ribosomal protein L19
MKNAIIDAIEAKQKKDVPVFNPGDVVKVHFKIIEGKKERVQIFEGVVIKVYGKGPASTATVRKIIDGVGVEKTFYINSPGIPKIEVVKYSKVRRARLFYLRDLLGSKETRIKENKDKNIEAAVERSKIKKEEAKKREEEKQKAKADAASAAEVKKEEAPKA